MSTIMLLEFITQLMLTVNINRELSTKVFYFWKTETILTEKYTFSSGVW